MSPQREAALRTWWQDRAPVLIGQAQQNLDKAGERFSKDRERLVGAGEDIGRLQRGQIGGTR